MNDVPDKAAEFKMSFRSKYLPFYALLKREILRFFTAWAQTLITPAVTATLYFLVFGVSLGRQISVVPNFTYLEFVIPGLIIMGVAQHAFMNSSSSLFMARYLGFLPDWLVTPVTPVQFIMAFTLASMVRGFIVGFIIFVISLFFSSFSWHSYPLAFVVALLTSFFFAQLGLIIGIFVRSFDNLAMFTNFLLLPLIYLGGLFYPVNLLPGIWAKISLFNPLYYIIDSFRLAALGISELDLVLSLSVLCVMTLAVFIFCTYLLLNEYGLKE